MLVGNKKQKPRSPASRPLRKETNVTKTCEESRWRGVPPKKRLDNQDPGQACLQSLATPHGNKAGANSWPEVRKGTVSEFTAAVTYRNTTKYNDPGSAGVSRKTEKLNGQTREARCPDVPKENASWKGCWNKVSVWL